MTAKEIREKETEHLKHELVEKRKHLFDLRSQAVTEKLEDPSQLRKTKKDIARMQTILKQRETEQQPHAKKKSKQTRKSQTAAAAAAAKTAAAAAATK
jgi:large subunit ribosomal protein L29